MHITSLPYNCWIYILNGVQVMGLREAWMCQVGSHSLSFPQGLMASCLCPSMHWHPLPVCTWAALVVPLLLPYNWHGTCMGLWVSTEVTWSWSYISYHLNVSNGGIDYVYCLVLVHLNVHSHMCLVMTVLGSTESGRTATVAKSPGLPPLTVAQHLYTSVVSSAKWRDQ